MGRYREILACSVTMETAVLLVRYNAKELGSFVSIAISTIEIKVRHYWEVLRASCRLCCLGNNINGGKVLWCGTMNFLMGLLP